MFSHVDQIPCLFNCQKSSFYHCFRVAYKCYYRPVGSFPRVYIQQPYTFHGFNLVSNLFNDIQISTFAEIGNTFNNWLHTIKICMLRYCLLLKQKQTYWSTKKNSYSTLMAIRCISIVETFFYRYQTGAGRTK